MESVLSPLSSTVVFAIESGYLESQTLLAIECLRHFGGRFADLPVLAITPRFGPGLSHNTLKHLDNLGVIYVKRDLGHRYSWFPFMNKALAVMLAEEEYVKTEQIIWLDSDVLVVREPELFWLNQEYDFAICSTDKNVGSSGSSDKNESYWLALCEQFGIHIEQLPWIVTEFDKERVRFRLHSGVFAFRTSTGLGKEWVKACEQMFDSQVVYSRQLPFPGDDVALAFAIVLLNLRWKLLPASYNYPFHPSSNFYIRENLQSAQILHYHYAMSDARACSWALTEIEQQLPELYAWLKPRVPINPKVGGLHRSFFRRALKELRDLKRKRFLTNCEFKVES